jgi:hypothetical protein
MTLIPSVFSPFRIARRKTRLRNSYRELLAEASASADDLVSFHLSHLQEYWARCIAAAKLSQPLTPAFATSDTILCIMVGTDMATHDVLTYSKVMQAQAFDTKWQNYTERLLDLASSGAQLEQELQRTARAFEQARQSFLDCRARSPRTVEPHPNVRLALAPSGAF